MCELRRDVHALVDHTRVEVYSTSAAGTAGGCPARALPPVQAARPPVSLIATVRDEARSIDAWLTSLLRQTRLPDEIVVVDGGSTDGTYEALRAFAARSPVPVRVAQAPGANIARGRNLAIAQARGPIIACTDAGCELPSEWLAAITGPFAVAPDVEVAAGYYEVARDGDLQRAMAAYFAAPAAAIDAQRFLPSGRSVAFRKEAWWAVDGYPEWLSLTAEDTLFAVALKGRAARWAFVPEAVVRWHARRTLGELFAQVRAYGRGDGEAGLFPDRYCRDLRVVVESGAVAIATLACVGAALADDAWWLFVALLPLGWLVRRIRQITVWPPASSGPDDGWPFGPVQAARAWLLSALVGITIKLALAIGFIAGVRRRVAGAVREG